jgi:putative ABC transport system substrate-binding protein
MREDAGCAERFLCALFATAVKPISDLRLLISGLCALLLALCSVAEAQQSKKVRRIAWLTGSTLSSNTHRIEAFRQGLRDLGYVEGTNILIEWRGADGNPDRQPVLVAELLRLEVDVIVTSGGGPTRAAKETTATIPIVFAQDTDPIGNGFVASLARPGGNITGLSRLAPKLTGKQIDLLKEVVSKLSRVAVFANLTSPSYAQVLIIGSDKFQMGRTATCGLSLEKSSLPASRKMTVRMVENRP